MVSSAVDLDDEGHLPVDEIDPAEPGRTVTNVDLTSHTRQTGRVEQFLETELEAALGRPVPGSPVVEELS